MPLAPPVHLPASSEFLASALYPLAGSLCSRDRVQPQGTDSPHPLRRQQFALVIWKEEGQRDPQNKLKIKSWMCPLPRRTSAISPASAYQAAWASSLPAPPRHRPQHLSFLQLQPPNSPEPPGVSAMARCHSSTPCPVVSSFLRLTFPLDTQRKEACHPLPLGRHASWSRPGLFHNNILFMARSWIHPDPALFSHLASPAWLSGGSGREKKTRPQVGTGLMNWPL